MGDAPSVSLRAVSTDDIQLFFEYQRDPDVVEMSAFPARSYEEHVAHWRKITTDPTVVTRTIVADGHVVGNIGSWSEDGTREIGYVLGKDFWGQGIATQAVRALLEEIDERPVAAWVAEHNVGSLRVLEKCGFVERDRPAPDEKGVQYVVMELK